MTYEEDNRNLSDILTAERERLTGLIERTRSSVTSELIAILCRIEVLEPGELKSRIEKQAKAAGMLEKAVNDLNDVELAMDVVRK